MFKKVCFIILLFFSTTLFAAGLELYPQTASMIATAAAGSAALTQDGTTAYTNPAGLTKITKQNMVLSLIAHQTSSIFKGNSVPTPTITGFNGIDQRASSRHTRYIPTILYGAPINQKWGFGFSMTTPYQSEIDYGTSSFTRFGLIENHLRALNFNVALGYQLVKSLSIGLGLSEQEMRLDYRFANGIIGILGDNINHAYLRQWKVTWNAGLLWNISPKTALGLTYRPQVVYHIFGNSNYRNTQTRAYTHLVLPPQTTLSLSQIINTQWKLLGTLRFVQWSKVNHFDIHDAAECSSPIVVMEQMHNAWEASIGANYQWSQKLGFDFGAGFNQATVSKTHQTIGFANGKEYVLGLGSHYQINPTMKVAIGYSHIFMNVVSVNNTITAGSHQITNTGRLYQNQNLLGLSFDWTMD